MHSGFYLQAETVIKTGGEKMSKYIVENCPAAICYYGFPKELASCFGSNIHCADRSDCEIKQIINLCRNTEHQAINCDFGDGKRELAKEILKILKICKGKVNDKTN